MMVIYKYFFLGGYPCPPFPPPTPPPQQQTQAPSVTQQPSVTPQTTPSVTQQPSTNSSGICELFLCDVEQ